ncbi:MAG: hypothetical protein Q8R16_01290 [bacterium]|nr:hypothetical protein [bacterium]
MTKRVKRSPVDEPALVEPRSFEELAQRAHEATLNERGELERKPRFWDCFHNEGGHKKCFAILGRVAGIGYVALAVGFVAWAAGSIGGGLALPPDHGVVRFFMATTCYVGLGGVAAASFGWIGGYCSWLRSGRRCQTSAKKKLDGPIAKHVTAYLGKLIAEEQRRLIGEGSEIEGLRGRTDEVLQRAQTLKERLAVRVREEQRRTDETPVPAYLSAAFDRAEKLVKRLARSRDRLNEHRAKLDAFFEGCRARVQAAEKPLNDLELVEAVEVLDAEGERLGAEVQEIIIRSTGDLYGRLQQLRSTLGVSLAHAGVHLALATPTTSNIERDATVLEDTIARFRPPKVIEGDAAEVPRTETRRQIGIS